MPSSPPRAAFSHSASLGKRPPRREIADRVVVMRHGKVREEGDVAQVFGAPRDAYTRALLAENPEIIKLIVSLFATSQFLSRSFIQHPEILDALVSRAHAGEARELAGGEHRHVHGSGVDLPADGRDRVVLAEQLAPGPGQGASTRVREVATA